MRAAIIGHVKKPLVRYAKHTLLEPITRHGSCRQCFSCHVPFSFPDPSAEASSAPGLHCFTRPTSLHMFRSSTPLPECLSTTRALPYPGQPFTPAPCFFPSTPCPSDLESNPPSLTASPDPPAHRDSTLSLLQCDPMARPLGTVPQSLSPHTPLEQRLLPQPPQALVTPFQPWAGGRWLPKPGASPPPHRVGPSQWPHSGETQAYR